MRSAEPTARWLAALRSARVAAAIDSAAAAGGSFAIVITLANLHPSEALAGYGASLALIFALLSIHRLMLVVPAAIVSDEKFQRRLPVLLGAHLAVMAIVAFTVMAAFWTAFATTANAVWGSALVAAPAILLLQFGLDFERTALLKLGRAWTLAAAGLATLAGIVSAATAAWVFRFGETALLLALAGVGALRLVLILTAVLRVQPCPPWPLVALGARRQGAAALAQLAGAASCSHAPVLALAALAPPTAAAAFVAMRTLYAPIQVLLRSIETVDRTRFHDRDAASKGVGRVIVRAVAISGLLCLPFAAAGPWLIPLVYGSRFESHLTTFLLWACIISLMNGAAAADAAVMHEGRFGGMIRAQIAGGVLAAALSIALARPLGDMGAALAAIAGWTTILLLTSRLSDRRT